VHEFVIGDAEVQEEHEVEMQEMSDSGMPMGDEPNALVLEAGETKSITWHFTVAGESSSPVASPVTMPAG
jgi:uncharacterized cupredoxin-like copper-binding protein